MQTVTAHITEYRFEETPKMHGVKRVLVFCILVVILPATLITVPLYLRRTVFADVTYPVAESDIIEIRDGISSIFCERHSLTMSSHFNAFQLQSKPEISTNRKHIRLKKSMTLPDDTLEYWGFYLLKGARVQLKFCSRYDGSRILVVKGQRILRTCGLLDHNKNKLDANFAQGHEQVKVFFEDMTEITSNFPAEELDVKTKAERDSFMDAENHGGEDLSEDIATSTLVMPNNSTTTARSPKMPRKKLKKGSPNSNALRHRKHDDDEQRNATNATNEQNTSSSFSGSSFSHVVGGEASEISTASIQSEALKVAHRLRRHFKHKNKNNSVQAEAEDEVETETSHLSHIEREHAKRKQKIYNELYARRHPRRVKRNEHVYDRKYSHGGNAVNFTMTDESNSVSSFETGLFDCFNGAILLAEGFPPSHECLNTHFLENGSHRMLSKHDITEDGYYYYIFYSDNDLVRNDIHAIFDIYKPTFQYSNLSDAQGCVNATNCTFSIGFLSDEIVVVEIPTRDGIEHEEDDITYLVSTCHPRTEIYAIFPILVLLLILSCSFL